MKVKPWGRIARLKNTDSVDNHDIYNIHKNDNGKNSEKRMRE